MGTSILLALLLTGCTNPRPAPQLWLESVAAMQVPGYHPMLRFGSWDVTRFERRTTYLFLTPDMVQEGQFEVSGTQYSFRAVMANELENSDKSRVLAELDSGSAFEFDNAYARSMQNFRGKYNPSDGSLTVTYLVKGTMRSYQLHDITAGDDNVSVTVSGSERGLVGLWQAPEPHPDMLDARTRGKIDDRGMMPFVKEAGESDGSQFGVMDLLANRTFRIHDKAGTWSSDGRTLTLMCPPAKPMVFQISNGKLMAGGKVAYVR